MHSPGLPLHACPVKPLPPCHAPRFGRFPRAALYARIRCLLLLLLLLLRVAGAAEIGLCGSQQALLLTLLPFPLLLPHCCPVRPLLGRIALIRLLPLLLLLLLLLKQLLRLPIAVAVVPPQLLRPLLRWL
jgi:hypothetical protein